MRVAVALALVCATVLAGCGGGGAATRAARTSTASSGGPVLLGAKGFLTDRVGWGTPHPNRIDGGGDPALVITRIDWHGWGDRVARGVGRTAAYRLGGSYYAKLVRAELRAYRIGRCRPNGPRTYMALEVRTQARPRARMGPWYAWGGEHGLCSYP